ncbi:MAG: adenosine deaminase [Psychrilyobacter sp.]|nr:adenosine deaminase [Psychrilyobacter sp.]
MGKTKTKGKKIKGKKKNPGRKINNHTIKGNIKRKRLTKIEVFECSKLPKIDLHCHLDGSLRPQSVLELLAKEEHILDYQKELELIKAELVAPKDCNSLNEYLVRFELPIKVMQTIENLERVSFELFEDAAKENIKYLEVRFAPQQHKERGLKTSEIISAVIKGMERAKEQYEINGNYILSCMRHLSSESAMEIVEEGREFIGKGVVAVDLCGGEENGFAEKFIEPMKKAKDYGYHITIHAGETGYGKNVTDAIILLGAERIGHGVFITNDELAYELVKEKGIPLEICPTSNIHTKAVFSYEEHPFYKFYEDGIIVTLNTDNRTVSDLDMTKECCVIRDTFDLTFEEYKRIYISSVDAAFISEEEKEGLKKYI